MSSIIDLFDNLSVPEEQERELITFSSTLISGFDKFHIGKDSNARPALILDISTEESSFPRAIELENLRVDHNILCQMSTPNSPDVIDRFSIVHCLSRDRALHIYFLETLSAVLGSITTESAAYSLTNAINKIAELFYLMKTPQMSSTQGLWAELFLIINSNNPNHMLEAWHSDASERYDFSSGDHRIEVKCSRNRKREHYFSLEQAYPSIGTSVLIASLFVEQSTHGITLGELWDQARDHVVGNPDLLMKIENVCLTVLGTNWENSRQQAFDEHLASESLTFFNIDEIPRVSEDNPVGVSEIRFRSNLGLVGPVSSEAYRSECPLYSACLSK